MASIRTFNTNLPHVFRFPEWTSGIAYPKGSIVAEETAQNGVVYNNYYVAIVDVQNQTNAPSLNTSEWNLVFQDPGYDSEIIALLTDSDFIQDIKNAAAAIPILQASIDSEQLERRGADSDLQVNMDSERHDWKAGDSDLYVAIDSERHDWKAGDSDIYHRIRELDSDIAILFARTDSDEDAIQAIKSAALEGLDSEIKARIEADSDFEILVRQTIHDYLSNDSEHDSEILNIRRRLDSDFDAAIRIQTFGTDDFAWGPKPYITNTDYFIDEGELTNHTLGYLWVSDNTNNRIYVVLNGLTLATHITGPGAATTTTDFTDANGVPWRRGALIEESPGDDADVSVYQNKAAALPIVTNANLYAVVQRYDNKATHVEQVDLDTAFRRTVTTVVEMDSDINYLLTEFGRLDSDNDSELGRMRHDIDANDSDIRLLFARTDSDDLALQHIQTNMDSERHDWKAGDSDIYAYITKYIDSDIKLTLEHDSELFIKTDSEEKARRNADSDIYNGYIGVQYRYVRNDFITANITGAPVVMFDAAGAVILRTGFTGGWVWNSFNDRLVVIDSDGGVLYNEVHNDEPIYVELDSETVLHRGTDTLTNVDIQELGTSQISDDLWNFRYEHIKKFTKLRGKPKGYDVQSIMDSDVNLHDADSDKVEAFKWIGTWMRERDSDIKMEIHDRKAGDSDLYHLFYVPEETITLATGTTDYTLTENLLNENTRWNYRAEIAADAQIYTGVVNDHFEIEHDGTAWVISVDGVDDVQTADILITGTPTVSGAAISVPFDINSNVTINPTTADNSVSMAFLLYQALLDKQVRATHTVGTPIVSIVTQYSDPNVSSFTSNGVTFNYTSNTVVDNGFYYHEGDTITIKLK